MGNEIAEFNGVAFGDIAKVNGVAEGDITHINGMDLVSAVGPTAFTVTNYTFNGERSWGTELAWDPDTDTLIVLYGDDGNNDYPTYRLGKLSANTGNTTITWQSEVALSSAGAGYHNKPVYDTGNDRMGLIFLESGADSTNRYRIAFGTISNSGSTPSMSVGTHTTIHATSAGNYNQGDVSSIGVYWAEMGAVVTGLEYGDDDGDANFVKAFKVNTSDNSVLTGDQDGLMFADTDQEFYQLVYDEDIGRVVVFSFQKPSSTNTILGNILDFDSSSTNGLTLELEHSLPGTTLFSAGVASGYDAGAWACYNTSANIHHVLINETADSTKKIRNVKISGSDGSFTMDPHTTYALDIPSSMDDHTTVWFNAARGLMGLAGTDGASSSGVAVKGLGYTFTEDTGTEANSTFTANGTEQTLVISDHNTFYGRYLSFPVIANQSDMHTGNLGAIMSFYGGSRTNEGVILGFDTGG